MNTVEATFQIVTPMFIGGADQTPVDGVRPPSVKGALRFWWRALNWGKFRTACSCDELALMLLHKEECRIFGTAASDGGGGQGCFLLTGSLQPATNNTISDWPKSGTGAGYLAFGILESGDRVKDNYQPQRTAIPDGGEFKLRFIFKPGTSRNDIVSVLDAVEAWGRLGGLGSRSRRGMGSIALETIGEEGFSFTCEKDYLQWVKSLLGRFCTASEPPYTAFSSGVLFHELGNGDNPKSVLDAAGNKYKNHRGKPSKLRGVVKVPFGLPLQDVSEKDRRASPLFFHVHPIKPIGGNIHYLAVCLYFPTSIFHPNWNSVDMTPVSKFAS